MLAQLYVVHGGESHTISSVPTRSPAAAAPRRTREGSEARASLILYSYAVLGTPDRGSRTWTGRDTQGLRLGMDRH